MKPLLVLLCASALALFAGCNRSGVINSTATLPGTKGPAVERIAHGKEVNLRNYVVPGRTTIFEFTSDFDSTCRALAPALHKLHEQRDDVVVVEVDLNRPNVSGVDWHSPVAEQYMITAIPAFKIYGNDTKLQLEGEKAHERVNSMLR
jgi:thiol-disulfide isomerase/thioredoxin